MLSTGLRLGPEEYLSERNMNRRRLWSKLRAGCLELRVKKGRCERLTVAGVQELVRWTRSCTLCYREVEDAAHMLCRCPAYDRLRTAFGLGPEMAAKLCERCRMLSKLKARVGKKACYGNGSCTRAAMEFLEQVMSERARLVEQQCKCRG